MKPEWQKVAEKVIHQYIKDWESSFVSAEDPPKKAPTKAQLQSLDKRIRKIQDSLNSSQGAK